MFQLKKFTSLLNMNRMYKKKFFRVILYKPFIKLIEMLIELNMIHWAAKIKQWRVCHYQTWILVLNLNSKLKLVPVSYKTKRYVSLKTIKNLVAKKKWTAILSTNRGLLTTKQCIKYKVGGILLYNVMVDV